MKYIELRVNSIERIVHLGLTGRTQDCDTSNTQTNCLKKSSGVNIFESKDAKSKKRFKKYYI